MMDEVEEKTFIPEKTDSGTSSGDLLCAKHGSNSDPPKDCNKKLEKALNIDEEAGKNPSDIIKTVCNETSNINESEKSSNLHANGEPVQVQKVDSSEKNGSVFASQKLKGQTQDSPSGYRFLLNLPNGSQFIIPENFSDSNESTAESTNANFLNSMPAGLIQILPSVLNKASSIVDDSKKDPKYPHSERNKEDVSKPKIELSHSSSSLFIQIPTSSSLPSCCHPSLKNIFVRLCPLSPSHITNNVEIIGPPLSPSGCQNKPTFLITFGEVEETNVESNASKCDTDATLKGSITGNVSKVDSPSEINSVSDNVPMEANKSFNKSQKQQLGKQGKGKQVGGKKKRRGRKKSADLDFNELPQFDRLICNICPEPSENPNSSLELNCNEVGPTYGIRITQAVSRCFVCTVELKSMRDVWQHAVTNSHKEKVHNLLVNQSKKRKGLPVRQNSTSKLTIDSTQNVKGTEGFETQSFNENTPETKEECSQIDSKKIAMEGTPSVKTDSIIDNQFIESIDKVDFEKLEMPKLTEEKMRLTRNNTRSCPQTPLKRRRVSENGTDSLPVLEKITCSVNTCSLCGKEFDDVVQKLDHAMTQHKEYENVLNVLGSIVHSALDGEELRACIICKKVYNGIENFLSHLIAAHQVKPHMLESVELAQQVITKLLDKKPKPTENQSDTEHQSTPTMITPLSADEEISPRACQYCKRIYTTESRLQHHYKLTGHKKMIVKRNRPKKKCEHCNRTFKSVVACKAHLKRTSPSVDGSPCRMKPRGVVKEGESPSKKPIVRVPGGGIKEVVPVNNNLTCLHCNELFSTVHTFHLHSRTTTPTEKGCIPLTPSFKVGGRKLMFPATKVLSDQTDTAASKPRVSTDSSEAKEETISIKKENMDDSNHCSNLSGDKNTDTISATASEPTEEAACNNLTVKSEPLVDENSAPFENDIQPESSLLPEQSSVPEKNSLPKSSVLPEHSSLVENSFPPENNMPPETMAPESNIAEEPNPLSKANDSLSCQFCHKTFNTAYSRFMHNRLTSYKKETGKCVRPFFRRNRMNPKAKYSMNRKSGCAKRKIKRKKIFTLDFEDDLESDSYLQEIIRESKAAAESQRLSKMHQDQSQPPSSASYSEVHPDEFKLEPKLEMDLSSKGVSSSREDSDEGTSKVSAKMKSFCKEDCFCRICSKLLSTPWNRNAHERNVHEYDHKATDMPTMTPIPSVTQNKILDAFPNFKEEFRCVTCQKSFSDFQKLNTHYEITKHNPDCQPSVSNSECKYCKKKFASEFIKSLHNQSTIPVAVTKKCVPVIELEKQGIKLSERTTCLLCNKDFVSAVHRFRHENISHRSYFLKRKNDGSLNDDEESGFKLVKVASGSKMVSPNSSINTMKQCKVCHKEFLSASQLHMHYAKAHNKPVAVENGPGNISDLSLNMQLDGSVDSGANSFLSASSSLDNETSPSRSAGGYNSIERRTCRFCLKVFTKVWNCKVHEETVHQRKMKTENAVAVDYNKSNLKPKSPVQQSNLSLPVYPGFSPPAPTQFPLSFVSLLNTQILSKPQSSTKPQLPIVQRPSNQTASSFSCVRCKRTYNSADKLQRHYFLTSHNDQKAMAAITDTCPCCKKGFKSLRALKIHMRVTVPNLETGVCVYRVGLEMMQAKNTQGNSDPTSKICRFCPREFATAWHRKIHETRSHKPNVESSKKLAVQSQASTKKTKKTAVSSEKGMWLFRDSDDKYTVLNGQMLRKLCRVCHKIFSSHWYMRGHVKKNHPNMLQQHVTQNFEGEYSCPSSPVICVLAASRNISEDNKQSMSSGMSPVSPSKLKMPKPNDLSASENSNFEGDIFKNRCKVCKRGFKWHSALEEHEKTCNTANLSFKCRICGIMFKDRRQLGPHWRKHKGTYDVGSTSVDMFICLDHSGSTVPIDKPSRSSVSLTARMQGREMSRPKMGTTSVNSCQEGSAKTNSGGKHLECYRCAGCNKIFMNAVKFIQHRLTHFSESSVTEISDKKPFCCEVCNMVLEHHTLVQVHLLEHLRVERRKSCYVHNTVLKPGMLIRPGSPPFETDSPEEKEAIENGTSILVDRPDILDPAVTNKPMRRYSCKFCRKRFPTISKYLCHVKTNQCKVRQQVKDQVWQQMKHVQETGKYVELDEDDGAEFESHDMSNETPKSVIEWNNDVKMSDNVHQSVNANDCRFCGKMFKDFHFRENHELLQCEHSTYCKSCLVSFQSTMEGVYHADLTHQKAGMMRCTPCSFTFDDFNSLESHVNSIHRKEVPNSPYSKSSLNKDEKTNEGKVAAETTESNDVDNNDLFDTSARLVLDFDSDENKSVSTNVDNRVINKPEADKTLGINKVPDSDSTAEIKPAMYVEDHPLRKDFTELLGILLSDDALLTELDWKYRPIDAVLKDVMSRTGIDTIEKTEMMSDLDGLRENINLMLAASLEDNVQETIGLGSKPVDEVVTEMLSLSQGGE